MNGCGSVALYVYGKPVTQGSMSAFPYQGKDGKIHASVTHKNKNLKPWREQVSWSLTEAWAGPVVEGPVCVHAHFRMQRPKCHFGTGSNAYVVKPSSPTSHTQMPDVDKLVRAILDAATGVVFKDDKQVTEIHTSKEWVEKDEGVLIWIETEKLEAQDARIFTE